MLKLSDIININEISSRLMSKYISKAEPSGKALGAVGTLTKDINKTDKADKRLSRVSKIKFKLDSLDNYNKPVTESHDGLRTDLEELEHHVSNDNPSTTDVNKMHTMIYNIHKKHGVSANSLYTQIADNDKLHQQFRDASSLD